MFLIMLTSPEPGTGLLSIPLAPFYKEAGKNLPRFVKVSVPSLNLSANNRQHLVNATDSGPVAQSQHKGKGFKPQALHRLIEGTRRLKRHTPTLGTLAV
jgi:hypothetical protein